MRLDAFFAFGPARGDAAVVGHGALIGGDAAGPGRIAAGRGLNAWTEAARRGILS